MHHTTHHHTVHRTVHHTTHLSVHHLLAYLQNLVLPSHPRPQHTSPRPCHPWTLLPTDTPWHPKPQPQPQHQHQQHLGHHPRVNQALPKGNTTAVQEGEEDGKGLHPD